VAKKWEGQGSFFFSFLEGGGKGRGSLFFLKIRYGRVGGV